MDVLVKIVHIAFAAAWFGHKLLVPRDVRRSLHGQVEAAALIERMGSAEKLGIATGLGTIASGAGLVSLTTGWSDVPLRIWVGLGAALLMLVVGATVARPAWTRVRAAIGDGSLASAAGHARSFNRALTLESFLWILALGAMVT